MISPAIKKYLAQYAEPESKMALPNLSPWDGVVAVPIFAESDLFWGMWESLRIAAHGKRILAIIVVNEGAQADEGKKSDNERLLNQLKARSQTGIFEDGPLTGWWLDRTKTHCFPDGQGVGLARKIGCDLACRLYAEGLIHSEFISTTDGDARVDQHFFTEENFPAASALLTPFEHECLSDTELGRALSLYDRSLFYYVGGLRYAGSPYSFHTLGSTISIRTEAYAQVRGFPKREAAEDFYLLNKLAKLGAIETRTNTKLRLVQRPSDRVPFGTGAGAARILAQSRRHEIFTTYDPKLFVLLKQWLSLFETLCQTRDLEKIEAALSSSRELSFVADKLQAKEAMKIALSTRTHERSLRKHLHDWFDGFRTLKFIHYLRDEFYPSLPLEECLKQAKQVGMSFPC